jgi:hypothetical protein
MSELIMPLTYLLIFHTVMGEEEALKELEAEDEARRTKGGARWNAISAAGFIAMGLELEQLWCVYESH